VAGDESARLNIGARITRENSENGALPIRDGNKRENNEKSRHAVKRDGSLLEQGCLHTATQSKHSQFSCHARQNFRSR